MAGSDPTGNTPTGPAGTSLEDQQKMAGVLITLGVIGQPPAPSPPRDATPPLEERLAAFEAAGVPIVAERPPRYPTRPLDISRGNPSAI